MVRLGDAVKAHQRTGPDSNPGSDENVSLKVKNIGTIDSVKTKFSLIPFVYAE